MNGVRKARPMLKAIVGAVGGALGGAVLGAALAGARRAAPRAAPRAVVFTMVAVLAACASGNVPTAPEERAEAAPARTPAPVAPPPSLNVTPTDPQPDPLAVQLPDGPPKVALLLPMSGRASDVGRALRDAAELALFDIAAEDFALAFYDTRSDPMTAAAMAERAIADGAQLIVGPLFAASAKAVAPVAGRAGVPVLAFSNDRSAAGDGVWVLGLLPEQQVSRVVTYASANGYGRIGVLAPANAYGSATTAAARASAGLAGAVITRAQSYQPGAPDLTDTVRVFANYDARKAALEAQRAQLRASGGEIAKRALARLDGRETTGPFPYDAVLLPEGGQAIQKLAPLMAFYDVDPGEVKYLGTALWADPALGREPTLVGGWFAAPSPTGRQAFVDRFRAVHGTPPLGLASLAYDAVGMAAVLARVPEAKGFPIESLTQPSGFAGTDGLFRLLADGTNQRGLAVLQHTPSGIREIDPAPTSFSAAIN